MVDVTTEITIRIDREKVAAYAANPENAPAWYDNIQSAEWVGEPGVREGAQVAFKARFAGKELAYTYAFVTYNPGLVLAMRTADGPFPMQTTYRWESLPNGDTRMILRNHGQPKGFSKLFKPLMAMMMRRANRKDLQKLKTILEHNG